MTLLKGQDKKSARLSKLSYISGISGFPLWALSYSWVPFAVIGRDPGQWIMYVVIFGEGGGFLSGLLSVGSGLLARRSSQVAEERSRAVKGLKMGVIVLALIVGPNLLGLLL